jgi:polysaccharide export outer membrane protein
LSDRDIVRVIPQETKEIYVAGLVNSPGQFELPTDQDLYLLDAIALAGGHSSPVADKVLVIRRMKDRPEPIFIHASLSKAKKNGLENIRLAAGDTITIEQTPATTVVGTISKFFRLTFGVASRTVL